MEPSSDNETLLTVQVCQLLPFGLLVSLEDGRAGIIREREIVWDRDARRRWRDRFRPGDILRAVPLSEHHNERLEMSLRLAQHDPWSDLSQRYHPGDIVEGIVTGLQAYGAFVEIEPGVTGLLHHSYLPSWSRERQKDNLLWPRDLPPLSHERQKDNLFWPGDHVKVAVELIEPSRRRLHLSLLRAWPQRWQTHDTLTTKHSTLRPAPKSSLNGSQVEATRLPLELLLDGRAPRCILVVEDHQEQLKAVAKWLQQAGQLPLRAASAEDALGMLEHQQPDMVLMDVGLPGMDGIQALGLIRERTPDIRCVLMTDWARAYERLAEIETLQAVGVSLLIKPFLPEDLLSVLLDSPMEQSTQTEAPSPIETSIITDYLQAKTVTQVHFTKLLAQLRAMTHASKVVLFALDPTQRKARIVAADGPETLDMKAVPELIHSPVRDVAEDQRVVRVEDVQEAEGRVRYMKPLIFFRSCLGVPLPGSFFERYALFLFYSAPTPSSELRETQALATALALGGLLERQQFQAQAEDLQRLALLGQLSRALVHEINHHVNPIGFALQDLQAQYAHLEQLARNTSDNLLGEIEEARETLASFTQAVRRLTEVARLFGRVTFPNQEQFVRVDVLVDRVINLLRDMADRASITIAVEVSPVAAGLLVRAVQVQQILLNIVINAVQQVSLARPHKGGRIELRVDEERRKQGSLLKISIEDDGPGIHRRLWERIFELGTTTRHAEGSGLGLYITRSLALALGGHVAVAESYLLWGSRFVVELPASQALGAKLP